MGNLERRRSVVVSRILARVSHPEAILVATVMAAIAAAGWLLAPFWLAVAIAAQMVVGGIAAVWLIGPVRVVRSTRTCSRACRP